MSALRFRLAWAALLPACSADSPPAPVPVPPPTKAVSVEEASVAEDGFHHLSQGSDQFNYAVFRAVERVDSTELFSDKLERYGLIDDATHPEGLPIGLAVSRRPGMPQDTFGQTCAACHVGRIEYQGQGLTIDGAPNLFQSRAFFDDLTEAFLVSLTDEDKLYRMLMRLVDEQLDFGAHAKGTPAFRHAHKLEAVFLEEVSEVIARELSEVDASRDRHGHSGLARILLGEDSAVSSGPALQHERLANHMLLDAETAVGGFLDKVESAAERRTLLAKELDRLADSVRMTYAAVLYAGHYVGAGRIAATPEGPGRVDAFGTVRAQVVTQVAGPEAARPLTAPASIPHLWGVPSLASLHWQSNMNAVMGRNVLEAIGSGAVVDFESGESWVELEQLARLEEMTYTFEPPPWPDFMPPIDADKAARGRAIFEGTGDYASLDKGNCVQCHRAAMPAASEGRVVFPDFTVEELGVDGNHAANWAAKVGDEDYFAVAQALVDSVKATYYATHDIPESTQRAWELGLAESELFYRVAERPLVARPLVGIWATAPYLHNGSVPSLHDLLLPEDQRPTRFPLGHREYDPVKVGYRQDVSDPVFVFRVDEPVVDGAGKVYPELANGNGNRGHRYGGGLTDTERAELVEYLKTL